MKNTRLIILYSAILALGLTETAAAQSPGSMPAGTDNLWELTAGVGLSIGATSPVPVPREVKKVYAWYPNMNLGLFGKATYWWRPNSKWGLTAGLTAEYKGMGATTHVARMRVKVTEKDGSGLEGGFTGDNNTAVRNAYLTIPIMASYRLPGNRLRLGAGFYTSLLLQSSFKVIIDGDLLVDKVDGVKKEEPFISKMELSEFDFSDQIAGYDFGIIFDADYFFNRRLGITMGAALGVVPVVKHGFDYIPFKMFNLYSHFGFIYRI